MTAHIFQEFMIHIEDLGIMTLEKGTKKAVTELAKTIQNLPNTHFLLEVDATVLKEKDADKIAELVCTSFSCFRGTDHIHQEFVKITFSPDLMEHALIKEEDRQTFKEMLRMGGDVSVFQKNPTINFLAINLLLHEEINKLVDGLRDIYEKQTTYISEGSKKERLTIEKAEKKFEFRQYTHELITFYRSCFNESLRLLSPYSAINPNPSFQRDLVWDTEKKQRLIFSILNNLPIGSFYTNRSKKHDTALALGEGCGALLWDGKQRMHTLDQFIKNEFPVIIDGKEVYYSNNPIFFAYAFSSYSISVFRSEYDNLDDILEAYVVINKSLVKHTDEDLQKAEKLIHNHQ